MTGRPTKGTQMQLGRKREKKERKKEKEKKKGKKKTKWGGSIGATQKVSQRSEESHRCPPK